MEDLTKISLVSIIERMHAIDLEIDKLMLEYEKLRLETIRRFPQVEERVEFKKKELKR